MTNPPEPAAAGDGRKPLLTGKPEQARRGDATVDLAAYSDDPEYRAMIHGRHASDHDQPPADAVPHEAKRKAREAAATVLPDLMKDIAAGHAPLLRLLRSALLLAADEGLEAAWPLIAGQERARERERLCRKLHLAAAEQDDAGDSRGAIWTRAIADALEQS